MPTEPQKRLLRAIKANAHFPEYWPVVNDWVKDQGPAANLALRNINRTVDALIKSGHVTLDDDGLFHLTERGQQAVA